jgi:hypothetical protein
MARIYRMNGPIPILILSIREILSSCQNKIGGPTQESMRVGPPSGGGLKSLIGPRPAPKQTPLCLLDVLTAADQRLI